MSYLPSHVHPRNSIVFIKPDEEKARESEHGIITPDTVDQEKTAIGTVIAIGPKITDILVGDIVVFGVYAGEDVKFKEDQKDITYKLVPEDEIWSVITKKPE